MPSLLLQKFLQQAWRTWDWHCWQENWELHSLLQFAITMAAQLVLHSDEQSLHNGLFLGCPREDMTNTAKMAMTTVALRPAAPETIVVDG